MLPRPSAPWTLHTGLGPDDQASSLMLRVIMASFEKTGNPVPKGGGSELARALATIIEQHGGKCHTGAEVEQILVDGDSVRGLQVAGREVEADAVLANVSPTALYERLTPKQAVSAAVAKDTKAYRYGRGNMQIHLSLDAEPAWPDPKLRDVAMVHVTPGLNGVSRAVNEAVRGLLPAEATIVVGQHCAVDPGRAPAGKWTFWIQLQELPAYPTGDAAGEIACDGEWTPAIAEAYADRIIERLCDQIPNLRASILERNVISPAELGRINPNLVGGDPYCGAASLDQFLFWRPLPSLRGHETPVKNLYHIGAATHPGSGLSGTSGYLVAEAIK